jgi:two-component system sensor histidine kinase PilS (NtrC family)
VNTLVENVMQLGRRESPQREQLDLQHWLQEFVTAFCESHGLPQDRLTLRGERVEVSMNPEQLFQVMTNLCDNALRHSNADGAQAPVELHYGTDDHGGPVLDVIDHGPGVPKEYRDRLFEPFFTTGAGGTGLGLYIARELCNANSARLSYAPVDAGGSRFRIQFESRDDVALARPA